MISHAPAPATSPRWLHERPVPGDLLPHERAHPAANNAPVCGSAFLESTVIGGISEISARMFRDARCSGVVGPSQAPLQQFRT